MRSVVVYICFTILWISTDSFKLSRSKIDNSPIIYIFPRIKSALRMFRAPGKRLDLREIKDTRGVKPGLRADRDIESGLNATLRDQGVFGSFLRILFETLIDFPKTDGKYDKRLTKYITVLAECLYEMRYDYTRRLAKRLEKLSRKHEEDIKDALRNYISDLEDKLPHRVKFIQAMNSIFAPEEQLGLYDYLGDVRSFGKMDKMIIRDETRDLLDGVIMKSIRLLSTSDRRTLKKKLRKAIDEYGGWSYSSILSSIESSDSYDYYDLDDYDSSGDHKHKHGHKHHHKYHHKHHDKDKYDVFDDSFERKVEEIINKHRKRPNTLTVQSL